MKEQFAHHHKHSSHHLWSFQKAGKRSIQIPPSIPNPHLTPLSQQIPPAPSLPGIALHTKNTLLNTTDQNPFCFSSWKWPFGTTPKMASPAIPAQNPLLQPHFSKTSLKRAVSTSLHFVRVYQLLTDFTSLPSLN